MEIETFVGYKVVLEKNGRNYSPAMGICYEDHDIMPTSIRQQRLTRLFANDILSHAGSFSPEMVGKTAVFVNFCDAEYLYNEIHEVGFNNGYTPAIKFATVTDDLMKGCYGKGNSAAAVVAGRKIKIHAQATKNGGPKQPWQ